MEHPYSALECRKMHLAPDCPLFGMEKAKHTPVGFSDLYRGILEIEGAETPFQLDFYRVDRGVGDSDKLSSAAHPVDFRQVRGCPRRCRNGHWTVLWTFKKHGNSPTATRSILEAFAATQTPLPCPSPTAEVVSDNLSFLIRNGSPGHFPGALPCPLQVASV